MVLIVLIFLPEPLPYKKHRKNEVKEDKEKKNPNILLCMFGKKLF